jgi:hypothetical protein
LDNLQAVDEATAAAAAAEKKLEEKKEAKSPAGAAPAPAERKGDSIGAAVAAAPADGTTAARVTTSDVEMTALVRGFTLTSPASSCFWLHRVALTRTFRTAVTCR